MYIEGKACWLNHLGIALEKYNNCVHGTTKMTPFELVNSTKKPIPQRIPIDDKNCPNPKWEIW